MAAPDTEPIGQDIPSSAEANATALLRGYLTELRPASGERLPGERELAAELSIGRRALRRALDALEQEGMIWRLQGSGTFFGQPSMLSAASAGMVSELNSPEEDMLFRVLVEPALCRIAALRATSVQLDEIHYCLNRGI